jgi:hypothetical protein
MQQRLNESCSPSKTVSLRLNPLNPVYHDEHGLRSLKELVRSYLTITKDLGRVMTPVATRKGRT